MTTIDDLAQKIRDAHGIDTLTAARDVVTVHVDQIADDPELWDTDAQTLTPAGVEVITRAVAESYSVGAVATAAANLLVQIEETAAAIAVTEKHREEQVAARDELIRAALRTELRRADIAAAAGVKEARLYQIRDGRR